MFFERVRKPQAIAVPVKKCFLSGLRVKEMGEISGARPMLCLIFVTRE